MVDWRTLPIRFACGPEIVCKGRVLNGNVHSTIILRHVRVHSCHRFKGRSLCSSGGGHILCFSDVGNAVIVRLDQCIPICVGIIRFDIRLIRGRQLVLERRFCRGQFVRGRYLFQIDLDDDIARHDTVKADDCRLHTVFALAVVTGRARLVEEAPSGAVLVRVGIVRSLNRDTLDGVAGLVLNLDLHDRRVVAALVSAAFQLAGDDQLIVGALLHTIAIRAVERAERRAGADAIVIRARNVNAGIILCIIARNIGIAPVVGDDEIILVIRVAHNLDRHSRIDLSGKVRAIFAIGFFQLFILCFLRRGHLVDLVLRCAVDHALEIPEALRKALRKVAHIIGQTIQCALNAVLLREVAVLVRLFQLRHQCVKLTHKVLCVGQIGHSLESFALFGVGFVDLLQFVVCEQSAVNVLIAVVQFLLERGKTGGQFIAGFGVHINPDGSTDCHARQLLDLRAAGHVGIAKEALAIARVNRIQVYPAGTVERNGHVAVCIALVASIKGRRGSLARSGSRSAAVLRGSIKLRARECAILARVALQGRIRARNVQRQRFALGNGQCAGNRHVILLESSRLHIAHGVVRVERDLAHIGGYRWLGQQRKLYRVAVMQNITVGVVDEQRTVLIIIVNKVTVEIL